MVADDDHAVAREELGAFAVGGHEGPFLALQSFGAVNRHAFPGDQFGERVDLLLDASGPLGVDVDQAAAGMLARELGALPA